MENQKKDFLLPASIVVAALLISGSIIYLVGSKNQPGGAQNPPPPTKVEISSRDVILGDPKAPITLIEYGDYQCPWCGKFFTDNESKLRKEYIETGKLKMVYRNFIVIGPESIAAAQAAECAKDQSKFWPYHDQLYTIEHKDLKENNGNLTRDLLIKIATDLQLDVKSFTECIDSEKYASQVQTDTSEGKSAGIRGTPAVFVNGVQVGGFIPFEDDKVQQIDGLKTIIDGLLKT